MSLSFDAVPHVFAVRWTGDVLGVKEFLSIPSVEWTEVFALEDTRLKAIAKAGDDTLECRVPRNDWLCLGQTIDGRWTLFNLSNEAFMSVYTAAT